MLQALALILGTKMVNWSVELFLDQNPKEGSHNNVYLI